MKIASESLVERLTEWGVDTVFGLPGDGVNGIMEGLRRHRDRVRFVLVHHEEAAAFMATGYAKSTGRLGVCLATSGPGGLHLLNGLYDAKLDHAPVLAITGMQATSVLGTGFQQEVHLERVFEDVAEYNAVAHVPAHIPTLVDNAVRTALARRTIAHLTIPVDIQESEAGLAPFEGGLGLGRTPNTAPVWLPSFRCAASRLVQRRAPARRAGRSDPRRGRGGIPPRGRLRRGLSTP
jgi:pyruvate dehydrogenase (quinone)/pyruvate oxidase